MGVGHAVQSVLPFPPGVLFLSLHPLFVNNSWLQTPVAPLMVKPSVFYPPPELLPMLGTEADMKVGL